MQFSGNSIQKRVYSIQCKEVANKNEHSCLAGLWGFCAFLKISLYIIVLIVHSCFERMHGLNKLFFALDASAFLLHNYDRLCRIFSYILLVRNHMVFSRAIWNK